MNARKYSFPGGTITASMINNDKTLTITVEDNGFNDYIKHLFFLIGWA
jgi:signal transduction histidine kinase